MAPLVAGVLLAGQTTAIFADHCFISSFTRSGNTVTVTVTQNPPPTGYVNPKAVPQNYHWWVDQNFYTEHITSITVPSATTNVCVYVYSVDSELSYAIHDTVNGVTIYNGP